MPKKNKQQKHNTSGQLFSIISLSVSLTHRHMFRWHQGSMTGYSLCSTPQQNTDFLFIDPIIDAIIIIPNHKEMAHYSFTHTPENMCFLTHSDTFFIKSATTTLSKFQKGNEPRQRITQYKHHSQ